VMPGMNGRQLASSLAEMRPTLNVLFVSGYDEDLARGGGLNTLENPSAFLQKPFNRKALLHKVRDLIDLRRRNAIQRHAPYPPAILAPRFISVSACGLNVFSLPPAVCPIIPSDEGAALPNRRQSKSKIPAALAKRAKAIKVLLMDVDGTITDG